ncbi:MAG: HIT domain-containing protein [Myxococcales bacterium]|nr:HIT domain-containing protein [Myxococcales bacterium]
MDRLNAPWRIDYIKSEKEEGCVFCNALRAADDRRMLILHRGRQAFVIMNKYPYTNGHVMVAPYAHLGSIAEITPEVWAEIMSLAQQAVQAIETTSKPHGFNLGINVGRVAGAGVEGHLHLHIVPRWNGDVNFMTVLADCRVINQHIEETYAALAEAWPRMPSNTE